MSIAGLLRAAGHRGGAATAVQDASGHRSMDFRTFVQACLAFGNRLQQLSVRRGDRIALIGDQRFDYLLADYGVMAGGFVRVPLDPALSASELAAQIGDAGATLILCSHSRNELGQRVASLTRLPVQGIEALVQDALHSPLGPPRGFDPSSDDIASLNYTGGTSSVPKAVVLTHGALRAAVQNIVLARGARPGDVMLNVRPLWPIAAIVVLAHLCAGGTVIAADSFSAERFPSLVQQTRASFTSLVPTHLVRMLRESDRGALTALQTLRSIDVGAAAIPPETFAELIDLIGPRIGVLYGLTEAPWSCYQPPTEVMDNATIDPHRLKSAGRAVFGCDIAVDDGSGTPRPAGEGEILIRGAHLMSGYWNKPDLSAEALRGGWLHTGDMGVIDPQGRLSVTGRLKLMIRTGGTSVSPGEVEQVIREVPGVADVAVFGLPDQEWGEIVAAAVVAEDGQSPSPSEIAAHCLGRLSSHKRPKRIRTVPTLPRSHYGKVQLTRLREMFESPGNDPK
ncbi:MAG: class I adenylate-forming enzyme family protein [Betaproteobacteria bacterium]